MGIECAVPRWHKVWRLSDEHYGHVDVRVLFVYLAGKGMISFSMIIWNANEGIIAGGEAIEGAAIREYLQLVCGAVGSVAVCTAYRDDGIHHRSLAQD
jgi:hypothetical protein